MSRIQKSDPDSLRDIALRFIVGGDKAADRAFCVLMAVQRLHHVTAGTLCLAVFPLCFKFLNVRRVQKHDPAQGRCSARRKDLSAEPVLVKQREQAGVVDMRMCQENHIDISRGNRYRLVLIQIRSLFHAAVYQYLLSACLKVITASGHFMCSTYECQFHAPLSSLSLIMRGTRYAMITRGSLFSLTARGSLFSLAARGSLFSLMARGSQYPFFMELILAEFFRDVYPRIALY